MLSGNCRAICESINSVWVLIITDFLCGLLIFTTINLDNKHKRNKFHSAKALFATLGNNLYILRKCIRNGAECGTQKHIFYGACSRVSMYILTFVCSLETINFYRFPMFIRCEKRL